MSISNICSIIGYKAWLQIHLQTLTCHRYARCQKCYSYSQNEHILMKMLTHPLDKSNSGVDV